MKTRMLAASVLAAALGLGCHGPRTKATPGQTTVTSAQVPAVAPVVAPAAGAPDVATLVANVSPSVVNITATQELRLEKGAIDPFEFFFGRQPGGGGSGGRPGQRGDQRGEQREETLKRRGLGSGFILDGGHVITNAHVVENATTVRVTLSDEREFDARVKGRDERLDLAVLELQGAKDLPRVGLGQSEQLRVGEYVVAIGNPFGLGNTVTMGIVSAKGRELGAGPYDDFIQTDASINPGNSGGPLFNLRGEVIGISTAINPAGQGIGFAIPIDALKDVLPQLLAKGFVSRGKLGVAIQSVDAHLAKALGLDKARGALVADIEPGSAGDKAGLKPGDVIVSVDQTPIAHAHDLPRLVARRAPRTRVTLEVIGRNMAARKVDVTLDELPDKETAEKSPAGSVPPPGGRGDFGLELGDDPRGGVIVRGVDRGSTAADAVEPGDVILEVNGAPVKNAQDASAKMRGTKGDRPLLLKVQRNGRSIFVAIERK
jgi:serine protease Do